MMPQMRRTRAVLFFPQRTDYDDGAIMEMILWRLPAPVPPWTHDLEYSLFYGRPGVREIGHDNERGKGDHRHFKSMRKPAVRPGSEDSCSTPSLLSRRRPGPMPAVGTGLRRCGELVGAVSNASIPASHVNDSEYYVFSTVVQLMIDFGSDVRRFAR